MRKEGAYGKNQARHLVPTLKIVLGSGEPGSLLVAPGWNLFPKDSQIPGSDRFQFLTNFQRGQFMDDSYPDLKDKNSMISFRI
jgi:hypothetical protein